MGCPRAEGAFRKERAGRYPGGAERSRERRAYICLSTRSLSITLAREGKTDWSWALYRKTLVWNIVLRRFRYVSRVSFALSSQLHQSELGAIKVGTNFDLQLNPFYVG